MTVTQPHSMVMTRIAGRDYPVVSVAACFTCQSPHRMFIENELIKGISRRSIVKALQEMEPGTKPHPNEDGIAHHCKSGHLPLAAASQRALIERRAEEIGHALETAVEGEVDLVTVQRMVVARGFERMQSGEIQPDLNDVQQASRLLFQMEQAAGGGIDEQAWQEAMMVHLEIVQEFLPPSAWQAYAARLDRHPVLRALAERRRADQERTIVA